MKDTPTNWTAPFRRGKTEIDHVRTVILAWSIFDITNKLKNLPFQLVLL